MNYSIDITVATKRDLADAFDYIDGMLMNPSAADRRSTMRGSSFVRSISFHSAFPLLPTPCWQVGKFASFLFRII